MRLIIVSGRSGSGKSTALNVLEDNGFYCIDNLPASLLPDLAQRALLHTELLQPQVAVSIDARNLPSQLQRFPELLQEVRDNHINCDVLYLDADDETLLKRFSETRRRHPLTTDTRSLAEAIGDESQLLGPIADLADLKLDTTSLNLYQLRDTIKLRLLNKPEPGTAFLVESFGFKRGMPVRRRPGVRCALPAEPLLEARVARSFGAGAGSPRVSGRPAGCRGNVPGHRRLPEQMAAALRRQ